MKSLNIIDRIMKFVMENWEQVVIYSNLVVIALITTKILIPDFPEPVRYLIYLVVAISSLALVYVFVVDLYYTKRKKEKENKEIGKKTAKLILAILIAAMPILLSAWILKYLILPLIHFKDGLLQQSLKVLLVVALLLAVMKLFIRFISKNKYLSMLLKKN